jgi:hypothetical protein
MVFGGGGCVGDVRPELGVSYPAEGRQAETLNVQVVREQQTHIVFTNTSARQLGPGRLWVNQAYSKPIGVVGVGETVRLDLRGFRNEFGERFRAGGFFATRTPKDVVLVQMRERGEADFTGLVVVRGEAEQ